MQRELPGFYYDEAKGKYFRIQPNHQLPPGSSHAHSQQNVTAKRRAEAIELEAYDLDHRRKRELVDRTPGSTAAAVGGRGTRSGLLAARLGSNSCPSNDWITEQYAKDLVCEVAVPLEKEQSAECFTVTEDGFLYVPKHGITPSITVCRPTSASNPTLNPRSTYSNPQPMPSTRSQDRVRNPSSRYHKSDRLRRCLMIPGVPVIGLLCTGGPDPTLIVARCSYLEMAKVDDVCQDGFFKALHLNTLENEREIWDMAASPNHTRLALAGGAGLWLARLDLVYTLTQDAIRRIDPGLKSPEVTAVAFKDDDLLISGTRAGHVVFQDFRTPDQAVMRMKHTSAVSGIISPKTDHHVIVNGLQSTSLYDWRMLSESDSHNPVVYDAAHHEQRGTVGGGGAGRRRHRPGGERRRELQRPTRPLFDFRIPPICHSDQYISGRSVAYSADLDMVAIASVRSNVEPTTRHYDHDHDNNVYGDGTVGKVTLYSTKTGRTIASPLCRRTYLSYACDDKESDIPATALPVRMTLPRPSGYYIHVQPVQGVQIQRARDGPESIFVHGEGRIEEWSPMETNPDPFR